MPSLIAFCKKEYSKISCNRHVHHTIANTIAGGIVLIIGLWNSRLIVQHLGSYDFGLFAFAQTIVGLFAIATQLGYTQGYSRQLLLTHEHIQQRELMGAGILIYIKQVILMLLGIFISIPIIVFFYKEPRLIQILAASSIAGAVSVYSHYFTITTRNLNHMYWQAIQSVVSSILYAILLYVGISVFPSLNVASLLSIYFTAPLIPIGWYIFRYQQPLFTHIKERMIAIQKERKEFGIHIYIGKVLERITFSLDNLMLGKLLFDFVGFYRLTASLVQPIITVSTTATNSMMKGFVKQKRIPSRYLLYIFLLWGGYSILLLLVQKPLIHFLWGDRFLEITSYLYLFLVAALFQSVYMVFFNFLYSRKAAKKQKGIYVIRAVINLLGNIILIPLYHVSGAIIATLLSNAFFFFALWYQYLTHTREIAYE